MKQNFDVWFLEILKHEGGYVDHPKDPGGATNMGITFKTLQRWRGKSVTKEDVRNLTKAEAKAIYRRNYWDVIRADDLANGVDTSVADFAVNSGPGKAISTLQRVLGVADDGQMGPITLAAASKWDAKELINRLNDERVAFLKRLSTFPTFGKGWMNRVASVRATSLAQASQKPVETDKPTSGTTLLSIILALLRALLRS